MRSATKRIIMHSLMSILERKSMDEITVRMVCEKSGVSRQTFYNHYYCLMAVFEDIQMTAMPEVKTTVVQRFYAAALQFAGVGAGKAESNVGASFGEDPK